MDRVKADAFFGSIVADSVPHREGNHLPFAGKLK
jgi:hypothetical protein